MEEEIDVGDALNETESRLTECDGLSVDNLGDIDILHSKYEEIKAQLPGTFTYFLILRFKLDAVILIII